MKSIFILGVFLLLLVMMLLASCKPEAEQVAEVGNHDPWPMSEELQSTIYIEPGCDPMYAKNMVSYDRKDTIYGCVRFYENSTLVGKRMIIFEPIRCSLVKGDLVADNMIELAPNFKGRAVFIMDNSRQMTFSRNTVMTILPDDVNMFEFGIE